MWFRRRPDNDFQAEIECHIRLETDRLIAEGLFEKDLNEAVKRIRLFTDSV